MTIDATTGQALDRIDHALAVQDATPIADADWQPGDPLYDEPRGDFFGEQTVRPMLEVFDDEYSGLARCADCDVSWNGPDPCWVCGKTARHGFVTMTVNVDVSPFVEQMQEAFRRLADTMGIHRRLGVAHEAAITGELVRLTLGGRGPDRPELEAIHYSAGGYVPARQIRGDLA